MGIQRGKLVDKNIYIKWYNIAKEEVSDESLICERNKEEIFELISQENWIIFCGKHENKETVREKPEPNVFFDILSKEGNLTGFGRFGLSFNNLGAYDKFKTIMQGLNREIKEKITNELLNLKCEWNIKLERKIKENNYAQTPNYETEKIWNVKEVSDNIIDELIQKANDIRREGVEKRERIRQESGNPKKFYIETPVINLMEAEFRLTEEEFRDRISEIFKILALCLGVKSNVEVNQLKRQKTKQIDELKTELTRLTEEIPKKEALKGAISQITEEDIEKDKKRKLEIEEKITELEREIND